MANVTGSGMTEYLAVFHRAYLETASAFLPTQLRDALLRSALLEPDVRGLVSTQFGAGYEYTGRGAGETTVEVSSRRVEYILTRDAPAKVRELPTMLSIGGHDGRILYLTLEGAFPVRLTSPEASVRLVDVRFVAGNWRQDLRFAELFGDRSFEFWSPANAAARGIRAARDESGLALLDLERSKQLGVSIGEYVSQFKAKTVLILGDYSDEGLPRLEEMRAILTRLGYQPALVKDVPDEPHLDLQQKVVALGSIARFVIIDDSSVSGHLVEFPAIQDNRWVTLVLRKEGSKHTYMTRGASLYSTVIHEASYTQHTMDQELIAGVQWADAKLQELKTDLDLRYPWRTDALP